MGSWASGGGSRISGATGIVPLAWAETEASVGALGLTHLQGRALQVSWLTQPNKLALAGSVERGQASLHGCLGERGRPGAGSRKPCHVRPAGPLARRGGRTGGGRVCWWAVGAQLGERISIVCLENELGPLGPPGGLSGGLTGACAVGENAPGYEPRIALWP